MIVQVHHGNYDDIVLKSEKPVLVDFWASWCAPCRLLGEELKKLDAEGFGDVLIAKADINVCLPICRRYDVQSLPTLQFVLDGKIRAQTSGFITGRQIRDFMDELRAKKET